MKIPDFYQLYSKYSLFLNSTAIGIYIYMFSVMKHFKTDTIELENKKLMDLFDCSFEELCTIIKFLKIFELIDTVNVDNFKNELEVHSYIILPVKKCSKAFFSSKISIIVRSGFLSAAQGKKLIGLYDANFKKKRARNSDKYTDKDIDDWNSRDFVEYYYTKIDCLNENSFKDTSKFQFKLRKEFTNKELKLYIDSMLVWAKTKNIIVIDSGMLFSEKAILFFKNKLENKSSNKSDSVRNLPCYLKNSGWNMLHEDIIMFIKSDKTEAELKHWNHQLEMEESVIGCQSPYRT